jgi:hypothetical protein
MSIPLDEDGAGPTVAELLAALDEGGGVQGDDKWVRLGLDFDKWTWWKDASICSHAGRCNPCTLDNASAFAWSRDVKDVEQELLSEGVARLGHVTEEWLAAVEAFCASTPFDNVLTLGCERCGYIAPPASRACNALFAHAEMGMRLAPAGARMGMRNRVM